MAKKAEKKETMTSKLRKSKKFKAVRGDLLTQLEINGTVGEYFTDLAEDYMTLWVTKCLCAEDIDARGVSVDVYSATGVANRKKNESVDALLKTNAQMLKILDSMGIKADSVRDGNDDAL